LANVTYHDHPAGTTPDGSEEIPGWQGSAAKKFTFLAFRRLRVNPSLISAAGTDQSGATALSNSYDLHRVGTVGSGAGVKFAALSAGSEGEHRLVNVLASAASDLLLYPPSGGTINGLSVNTPVTIERGQSSMLFALSTVDWISVP
jgi:hypothetical protein